MDLLSELDRVGAGVTVSDVDGVRPEPEAEADAVGVGEPLSDPVSGGDTVADFDGVGVGGGVTVSDTLLDVVRLTVAESVTVGANVADADAAREKVLVRCAVVDMEWDGEAVPEAVSAMVPVTLGATEDEVECVAALTDDEMVLVSVKVRAVVAVRVGAKESVMVDVSLCGTVSVSVKT